MKKIIKQKIYKLKNILIPIEVIVMCQIEKRFKDEIGENLNEDDKEVIKITKDFEEASRKLSLLL